MLTTAIKKHLKKDPVLKPLIETLELEPLSGKVDVYLALTRSIVSQQLSVKAAETIYGRFLDLFPRKYPSPRTLLKKDETELRSVGLSRAKASYIKNVATFALAEKWTKKDWSQMEEEEVMKYLCQIKGVGPWTAQMILLFSLQRADVFPIKDLVIYQSIVELYDLNPKHKTLDQRINAIAAQWQPYRSYACRYLWAWRDQ